jgi:hypothetical protein
LESVTLAFAVVTVAALALLPAETSRSVLAAAASALYEAVPFLALTALLSRIVPAWAVAFAGCGCTLGPSARSVPAAFALALSFGPGVALARVAAAVAVAAGAKRLRPANACGHVAQPAAELAALVPAALAAGALQQAAAFDLHGLAPALQFVAGVLAGGLAAPCALGTAALAATLHRSAPAAAAGLLCSAGLIDARVFVRATRSTGHDGLAYGMLATALLAVGIHRGNGLVHPAIGLALLPCAVACAAFAYRYRRQATSAARVAPALMLAGAFAGASAPQYRATETTMNGLFAGERLTFTGALSNGDVVARYAITCCRADAAPVAVRLSRRLPFGDGTWLCVDGAIVTAPDGALRLEPVSVRRVDPPADPFVYR